MRELVETAVMEAELPLLAAREPDPLDLVRPGKEATDLLEVLFGKQTVDDGMGKGIGRDVGLMEVPRLSQQLHRSPSLGNPFEIDLETGIAGHPSRRCGDSGFLPRNLNP